MPTLGEVPVRASVHALVVLILAIGAFVFCLAAVFYLVTIPEVTG